MAQYTVGTVTVTNGSTTVQLAGGDAAANILANQLFYLRDEAVNGALVGYVVSATPTEVDEFTITPAWAGDTAAGKVYSVHADFSLSGYPLLSGDEAGFPALWNRFITILEAAGGGGGATTFQALLDTFTYSGNASRIPVVNAGATGLEPLDRRFLTDAIAEVSPATLSGRLVHYSALLGTLTASGDRVSQWNDISGNARHAVQDSVGPRLVGDATAPSYGLNFDSSAVAGDDIEMLATVPANQNTMFIFYIGRLGRGQAGSRNLWKTAHDGTIDTQTAGDIELAPAASGETLNLRISTDAGIGQLVPLGMFKNELPFVLALALNAGSITGWVAGQGQAPAAISTSYSHGSGFDTDRLKLGLAPDDATAHTMHELVLASTLPTSAVMQGLVMWAWNRYFWSQTIQDNPAPRFTGSPDLGGRYLRNWRRPVITTDGTNITEIFSPAVALAVADSITVKSTWTGALFRSSSASTFELTLLATVPRGWEIDVEQEFGTAGTISVLFASGATNLDGFPTSVTAGISMKVRCVRNTDGSSAEYVGYPSSQSAGGGGAGASPRKANATPSSGTHVLLDADRWSPENTLLVTTADNTRIEVPDGHVASWWKVRIKHTGCTVAITGDPAGRVINEVTDGAAVPAGRPGSTINIYCEGSNVVAVEGETGEESIALAAVDMDGNALKNVFVESEAEQTVASSSGTLAIDYSLGNNIFVDLTENITTHTLSAVPASGRRASLFYDIVQDSTDRTMVWPTGFDWGDQSAPTLPSGEGERIKVIAETRDGGTTWAAAVWWRSV